MKAAGTYYIKHGSRKDKFRIWYLSDLHILNKACAMDHIVRDVQEIRDDPFSFWIGGGDYADFIGYKDKRFDPDAVSPSVTISDLGKLGLKAMRTIRDIFRPIRRKCFGLLQGNHERSYELHLEQQELTIWLCRELDVDCLDYSTIFDVCFQRVARWRRNPLLAGSKATGTGKTSHTFRIFAHHGAGFAQTPGGKMNKLIQFMQSFSADIYFLGHVHDSIARKEPMLGADRDCTSIIHIPRLGVISGSYLKTYQQNSTTYGEQRGYRPVNLGPAVVGVQPDTRDMWAIV